MEALVNVDGEGDVDVDEGDDEVGDDEGDDDVRDVLFFVSRSYFISSISSRFSTRRKNAFLSSSSSSVQE